jgi:amidase
MAHGNAFMDRCEAPPTGSGPLDGLCFAVKDLIDVAGMKTGCGNPTWRATHPVAVAHAVCVEQLLRAGARCVGKTISDELAFSLLGENHFYGTPLNPRAPDRVPGGSSSGSASAVACGLVDFALGTDTGGSVRVPAGNCGIYGFRPSHGLVSVAGVNPLAPSLDTIGVLARDVEVLVPAALVLLGREAVAEEKSATVHLLSDAFALADPEIQQALAESVRALEGHFGVRFRETRLRDIDGDEDSAGLSTWCDTYCVIQWAEITSCLGAWLADVKPALGPAIAASFDLAGQLDRRRIADAVARRERYHRCLQDFLGPRDLICMPTAPTLAPFKGQPQVRASGGSGFYPRTLALTSVAGIGRLPQVSMPLAESAGAPVGLSLLAGYGRDPFLLEVVKSLH